MSDDICSNRRNPADLFGDRPNSSDQPHVEARDPSTAPAKVGSEPNDLRGKATDGEQTEVCVCENCGSPRSSHARAERLRELSEQAEHFAEELSNVEDLALSLELTEQSGTIIDECVASLIGLRMAVRGPIAALRGILERLGVQERGPLGAAEDADP